MEDVFKRAFGRITADEDLKRVTYEAVLRRDGQSASAAPAAPRPKGALRVKRLVAAACAAILLCALPVGAYAVYKTPTSYVSVDINPSVELGVNPLGRVVFVTAYNEDGETVIDGLRLKNRSVNEAVRLIVRSACDCGYVLSDGSAFIAITAETDSDAAAGALNRQAQSGAEAAMAENGGAAAVITNQVGLDRRMDAAALGITPGKLNLIEKLIALDPSIGVEDYLDASVTEIQNRFTELKKQQNHNQDQDQLQQQDQDQLQQHDQKHDQQHLQQSDDIQEQEQEQNSEKNEQNNHGQSTHNEQQNQEHQKEQNENGDNAKDGEDTQGDPENSGDEPAASPSPSPSDPAVSGQPGNHSGQTNEGNQNGNPGGSGAAGTDSAGGGSGNAQH